MAKKKAAPQKFLPHAYAAYLDEKGGVAVDGSLLLRWTGTHWAPIDQEEAERDAYRWLVEQNATLASADNARRAFRAACLWLNPVPKAPAAFVIPVQNGYLHLNAGRLELLPADPGMGLRYVLSCAYDPEGEQPSRFLDFLARVLPDEAVRARVQEYVGYTLLPDARYQRAQIWLGDGANGKGVLGNITQALHRRVAAMSLDELGGFHMSGLIDASLVYVDEVPRKQFEEQRLKSAIAGEKVPIDRKYRDPLSVRLMAKWLVLGNHLPVITDHSSGFWRRWDIVPFKTVIPEAEREPLLAQEIVRDELSGVLNWALEGLLRLQARGGFDVAVPEAMRHALFEAKIDTNSVVAWVSESEISVGSAIDTPKERVFDVYRAWCRDNALREVSSVKFWTRIRECFKAFEHTRVRRPDGSQQRLCNVVLPVGSVRECIVGAGHLVQDTRV
jgi:putative DNA primase/helicase